jgi:hypothetical protein
MFESIYDGSEAGQLAAEVGKGLGGYSLISGLLLLHLRELRGSIVLHLMPVLVNPDVKSQSLSGLSQVTGPS